VTEVYEVMRTARKIRRCRAEPVADDVLRRCLEAATWAPSGGNSQPWRFVVLRSAESRAAMREGAVASLAVIEKLYRFTRPDPADHSEEARNRRAVYELHDAGADVPAGVLFAFRQLPKTPPELQASGVFAAMENFLLACRAEGVGAAVTGWGNAAEGAMRAATGMPEGWSIAALVVVGWPKGRHGPVQRKPVEAVAYLDRWDQPFRGGGS
jgi:nitroreductase